MNTKQTQENKQHKDLTPLEIMALYRQHIDEGTLTEEQQQPLTKKQRLDVVDAIAKQVEVLRDFVQNNNKFGINKSIASIQSMCTTISIPQEVSGAEDEEETSDEIPVIH